MSLEKKQIAANMSKYLKVAEDLETGFMTEELKELIGTDLMIAPASTMVKLHNAFEGGLIDHILKVMKYAYKTNLMLPDNMQVTKQSLIKVVYLHQIGKCNLYVPNTSQWHRDKLGQMYEFNEDITSMRVGERSVFYALNYGVKLTDEEFAAIVNHDKVDDAMAEWHNSIIGEVLKVANKLAILEEKKIAGTL